MPKRCLESIYFLGQTKRETLAFVENGFQSDASPLIKHQVGHNFPAKFFLTKDMICRKVKVFCLA